VDAGNQVELPARNPGRGRRAGHFQVTCRLGHRVEGARQVDTGQDGASREPGLVQLPGGLDQRAPGAAAQVQPRRDASSIRARETGRSGPRACAWAGLAVLADDLGLGDEDGHGAEDLDPDEVAVAPVDHDERAQAGGEPARA
jgi:hypothetical protein